MPLPTSDIIAFIEDQGWDTTQESGAPVVPGPVILVSPDRLVTITGTSGPGYLLEGAADASGFQARVRGGQNDPADAEALAFDLDARIFAAQFPYASRSGQKVIQVRRLGSPPAPLSGSPDDGDRTEYTCLYVAFAGN